MLMNECTYVCRYVNMIVYVLGNTRHRSGVHVDG